MRVQNYAGSGIKRDSCCKCSLGQSVCLIRTTVGQYFNWYRASRGSLGDSWASCFHTSSTTDKTMGLLEHVSNDRTVYGERCRTILRPENMENVTHVPWLFHGVLHMELYTI